MPSVPLPPSPAPNTILDKKLWLLFVRFSFLEAGDSFLVGGKRRKNKQTHNSLELRPPKRSDLDPLCRRQLGSGSSEAEALTATAGVVGFFIFCCFFWSPPTCSACDSPGTAMTPVPQFRETTRLKKFPTAAL